MGNVSSPSIHDNNVYGFVVACAQRQIILYTEFRDGGIAEHTDVVFSGVVAHHFERALQGNILFDIKEVEPGRIVQDWSDLFLRQRSYDWPALEYSTTDELSTILKRQAVRGFEIASSYGLTGWVLATRMELRRRNAGKILGEEHVS